MLLVILVYRVIDKPIVGGYALLISKEFREKCKNRGFNILATKDLDIRKRTNVRIKELITGNRVVLSILNNISVLDFACADDTSSHSDDLKEITIELVEHIALSHKAKMVSLNINFDDILLVNKGFIPRRESPGYAEWEQLFSGSLHINGNIHVKVYDRNANLERLFLHESIVTVLEQAGIKDYKIKHQWFEIWVWWSSASQLRRVNIYPSIQGNFELEFHSGVTRHAKDQDELLRYIVQLTKIINIEEIAI